MKIKIAIAVLLLLTSCNDSSDNNETPIEVPNNSTPKPVTLPGLTLSISNDTFNVTYTRLLSTINANPNISIVTEVNHSTSATSVGLELGPSRIIFFGNPSLGTPLMQKNQLAGLDLPQKIVAFQDDNEDVYLGFNSTDYLTGRHQLENVATLPTINNALTGITTSASGGEIIISPNTTTISGERITTKTSTQNFDDTYNTLKTAIEDNPNLRVVVEVNHQENAIGAGLELRPTRLIIFANPNIGTPLMQNKISTAIDLPQKMLVWEDEDGAIKVSYNDPDFLKIRHVIEGNDTVLETIRMALGNLSDTASGL